MLPQHGEFCARCAGRSLSRSRPKNYEYTKIQTRADLFGIRTFAGSQNHDRHRINLYETKPAGHKFRYQLFKLSDLNRASASNPDLNRPRAEHARKKVGSWCPVGGRPGIVRRAACRPCGRVGSLGNGYHLGSRCGSAQSRKPGEGGWPSRVEDAADRHVCLSLCKFRSARTAAKRNGSDGQVRFPAELSAEPLNRGNVTGNACAQIRFVSQPVLADRIAKNSDKRGGPPRPRREMALPHPVFGLERTTSGASVFRFRENHVAGRQAARRRFPGRPPRGPGSPIATFLRTVCQPAVDQIRVAGAVARSSPIT